MIAESELSGVTWSISPDNIKTQMSRYQAVFAIWPNRLGLVQAVALLERHVTKKPSKSSHDQSPQQCSKSLWRYPTNNPRFRHHEESWIGRCNRFEEQDSPCRVFSERSKTNPDPIGNSDSIFCFAVQWEMCTDANIGVGIGLEHNGRLSRWQRHQSTREPAPYVLYERIDSYTWESAVTLSQVPANNYSVRSEFKSW